jgi:periplasmic copper chaperone A
MSIKYLAFAVGLAAASAAWAQSSQLEVSNAWARATPGDAANGAAYLTIQSPTADRLVSVSSPVSHRTELHTMSMAGNVMQMRPLGTLDIPAGQPVRLTPGGMHIMLLGLDRPLQEGQHFPLTLDFEKAGAKSVTVAVEKTGAMGPALTPQR